MRFLGELTKFGLFLKSGPERMLENIKVLLDNFHAQNIDVACNLLESCGRYLLNTLDRDYREQLNSMLDFMWRLKEKDVINSSQLAHIDHVFAICRPKPKRHGQFTAVKNENLNQVEKFIRFLIKTTLIDERKVERASMIFIDRIPWKSHYCFIVKELLMTIILYAKIPDQR